MLPGYGRFDPCDWGLGFELKDAKEPHWTGARNSPSTFGHFGRSGSFVVGGPRCRARLLRCCVTATSAPGPTRPGPSSSDAVIEQWRQPT